MDARQSPRVPLDSLAFLESDRDDGHGAVVNLSRTGAQLSSAYPAHPGDYLSQSLSLPDQASSLDVMLAAVRWVQGRHFGVEFIQIPAYEQSRLRDFLGNPPADKTAP